MVITEALCTGNSRYKAREIFTPKGVVLHSIGTPQPRAEVLQRYWQNNGSPYVVHYMVDDAKILHCMPDNYKCWHVCSPGNNLWIGIEMGEPDTIKYTSGATFTVSNLTAAQSYVKAAYKNAVELIAYLCKKYGWDPNTAVHTHYEVTTNKLSATDHVDPQHLWNGLGMGYSILTLRRDVAAAMNISSSSPVSGGSSSSGQIYRIRTNWNEPSSQVGAYSNLEYAKNACPDGYQVFDSAGNSVYSKVSNEYTLKQFIMDVQRCCGANVDGIAGNETISKTVTISAYKNRTHPVVKYFQKRLAVLGYSQVGEADGIAGSKFDAALKAFQRDTGCFVDGEATAQKKTWRKILGMS